MKRTATAYCRFIVLFVCYLLYSSVVFAQSDSTVMQVVKSNIVSDSVNLDEVLIKGTKVKFYFKKDTLVYDAADFRKEKGAVLSELINQLPGVDISPDGTIYVGGKIIEELLLNGKDFFDKDRNTILDNLPAFMVKDFTVYEHRGDSTSVIERERSHKGFVMDVRLKKEYERNYSANAGVGGGTDGHYYLSLFGLLINPNSRLSGFATSNDLNQSETYNRYLSIQTYGSGEMKSSSAGVYYNWDDDKKGLFTISGQADIRMNDCLDLSSGSSEYFYNSGNAFGRKFSDMRSDDMSFHTHNAIVLFRDFNIFFILNHSDKETTGESATAKFSSEQAYDILGEDWKDSISSVSPGESFSKYGITRQMSQSLGETDYTELYLRTNKLFNIANTRNYIYVSADLNNVSRRRTDYIHNRYEYFKSGQPVDSRNEYSKYENKTLIANFTVEYNHKLNSRLTLEPSYNLNYSRGESDSPRYLLQRLDGWGNADMHPLGTLPDSEQLSSAIDVINSSWSKSYFVKHKPQIELSYNVSKNKSQQEKLKKDFIMKIPLQIVSGNYNYRCVLSDTSVSERFILPAMELNYSIENSNIDFRKKSWKLKFSYAYEEQLPQLSYKLNIRNTSNPLFISEGNNNLKKTSFHNSSFSASYRNGKWDSSLKFNGDMRCNTVTQASIYNSQTGVTITRPMNVNGYWYMRFNLNVSRKFGADMKKSLSFSPSFKLTNNVGYVGDAQNSSLCKNTVKRYEYGGRLTYNGRISYDNYVDIAIFGTVTSTTGSRWEYNNQDITLYGLDLNLFYTLPWNIKLITNIKSNNYGGYLDKSMNINECIWNLSFSKTLLDGNLEIELLGSDLLNQKSLITHFINSSYRSETWNNYMKRYIMLKAVWKIHTEEQ